MKKIFTIASKELSLSFKSALAYIVLIVTVSVFNIFFFLVFDQNREASLRDMFQLMEFMFVFIIPLLTMKIFAEEKRSGTIELLMTCPVKNITIILGKYFGSLLFLTILLGITIIYYCIVEYFGSPDRGAVLAGYFGIWLEGALFVAIGLMTSSLTKSQIIAAMCSYVIIFLLYFSSSFIKYFDAATQNVIKYLSLLSHSENLSAGLVTTGDLTYYLSGIIFCLVLTKLSLENK